MITPAYVRTMAAYNAEMNRRLYDAAGRLSDAERRASNGAFWGSIHGTLVHILWGDSQWMSRFDGWERPATPIKQSDHFIDGWDELCAARDKGDAGISGGTCMPPNASSSRISSTTRRITAARRMPS
jgi:uncharacterized damage-inducible protein DinB